MVNYGDKDLNIYEKIIFRAITALLITALVNMQTAETEWSVINYVSSINTVGFIVSYICAVAILSAFDLLLKRLKGRNSDAVLFSVTAVCFGFFVVLSEKNIYLTITVLFFVVLGVRYTLMRFPAALKRFELDKRQTIYLIVFIMILTFAYVCSLVVLRYYLFKTPAFDFGIFSQMYYYMKETGLPMTTCERDYYLSHFAIHFSPVCYLLLPFYFIFPHPVTLIVLQLIVVMSGAIPLYLICKNRKFSNFVTFGLVTVFLLYPTMRTGLFYDFHENKFLPMMILWLIYFVENREMAAKKRNAGIIVFALLSLMIKEDAAIYVACLGLFFLAYKKERQDKIRGLLLFMGSVVYFLIVFYCLSKFGQGSSINSIGRYSNLMVSGEDGLAGMIMNMLKNPAYVFKQLMKTEKLEFLLWTMTPLLFIPLFAKKISMYILLIPYIVMNLLTDYVYQYDIGFQYTYGSCTLLIYMTVMWFEGPLTLKKKRCLILMLIASLFCTTSAMAGKNVYYEQADLYLEDNLEIMELLDTIPKEASVRATTWFVPALSERDEVYQYEAKVQTDYVVLDMRTEKVRTQHKTVIEELLKEGYETYGEIEEKIVILYKK